MVTDHGALESVWVSCPCCGESIELLVDCSVDVQDYIEDCEVCCHPMRVSVSVDVDGEPMVMTRSEDD